MTEHSPRTTAAPPDPTEAPTEIVERTSPYADEVDRAIEKHKDLRELRERARQLFEFNVEINPNGVDREAEKKDLEQKLYKGLGVFHTPKTKKKTKKKPTKDGFPDIAQREVIIGRIISIAETPEGYIKDTPELADLLREARSIYAVYVGGDPEKARDKSFRLNTLNIELAVFSLDSTIGAENKQAIVNTILDAAFTPSEEAMVEAYRTATDDEEPDALSEEAERRRREAAENKQKYLDALKEIDAADRLRGYERVKQLGALAMKFNKETFDHGDDLGIEAAKRIGWSKEKGLVGKILSRRPKYMHGYLHDMTVEGGNQEAFNSMSRGSFFTGNEFFKGRNDALHELVKKIDITTPAGLEAAWELVDKMGGRRAFKYRYDTVTHMAAERKDPELLLEVSSLYNFYHKQKATARVAVEIARVDKKKGEALAKKIKWPGVRNRTEFEISKL